MNEIKIILYYSSWSSIQLTLFQKHTLVWDGQYIYQCCKQSIYTCRWEPTNRPTCVYIDRFCFYAGMCLSQQLEFGYYHVHCSTLIHLVTLNSWEISVQSSQICLWMSVESCQQTMV